MTQFNRNRVTVMGRVVVLKNSCSTFDRQTAERAKTHHTLDVALNELKKQNGIDYRKLLRGDEHENQRMRLKQHQESMLN